MAGDRNSKSELSDNGALTRLRTFLQRPIDWWADLLGIRPIVIATIAMLTALVLLAIPAGTLIDRLQSTQAASRLGTKFWPLVEDRSTKSLEILAFVAGLVFLAVLRIYVTSIADINDRAKQSKIVWVIILTICLLLTLGFNLLWIYYHPQIYFQRLSEGNRAAPILMRALLVGTFITLALMASLIKLLSKEVYGWLGLAFGILGL